MTDIAGGNSEAGGEGRRVPWTIKAVLDATKVAANAYAAKRDETTGVWIGRAVGNQAKLEAGDMVKPGLFAGRAGGLPQPAPEAFRAGNGLRLAEPAGWRERSAA